LKIIEYGARPLHFLQNLLCFRGPDERLGVAVMLFDVLHDRLDQLGYGLEYTPPNTLVGDISKPAFDQVKPGTGSRDEMNLEPRMAFEPALHLLVFVGAIVVANQVNRQILLHALINQVQELEPLLVAVPRHTFADDLAFHHVDCRKE